MTFAPSDADELAMRLLDRLLGAGAAESVESLALALSAPRKAVLAALEELRRDGCELHSDPHLGLRLVRSGIGCWADYLRWACPHGGRGRLLEVYGTTRSTQDAAWRIAHAAGEAADGAVAAAYEQTAGRGRLGRRWHAPAGSGAMFSRVSLAPHGVDPVRHANWMVLAAAVAVSDALLELMPGSGAGAAAASSDSTMSGPLPLSIKWPNDILVGSRKLAGILVESQAIDTVSGRRTGMVVGIGINVAITEADLAPLRQQDPSLADRITSLAMQGVTVDPLRVLARALDHLDTFDARDMLARWRARSTLSSQWIRVRAAGGELRGQVIDLDPHEGLILRTDDGAITPLPAATTTIL